MCGYWKMKQLVLWWPIDICCIHLFVATGYFLMKPLGCVSWSHSQALSLKTPLFKLPTPSYSSLSDWAGPDTELCP